MASTIESLASEKTALSQAVDEKESTLTLLRGELEQAKEALTAEKDSTNRTVEGLQNQLNEKVQGKFIWSKLRSQVEFGI